MPLFSYDDAGAAADDTLIRYAVVTFISPRIFLDYHLRALLPEMPLLRHAATPLSHAPRHFRLSLLCAISIVFTAYAIDTLEAAFTLLTATPMMIRY